ncbi:hypothetical protein I6A84_24420 [Frankia sp. CNm7]|uniref:Uncharacterized protein n=1 Tax=Frankia nepalensis TaxID=1836974 RepID=A0A937R887_9ACTN|nr:hypothetical protein [Frankia nepalensis]MBL7496510.1 hypothetical protein [Frankia nepalensis]MBL7511347.1 hypothetical protein [Frankia nepalensis]MBL7521149.1 hypothetical protein [Frankia nepalensis]MBL7627483.1 hypothetical protein [Frankia nepalensis]
MFAAFEPLFSWFRKNTRDAIICIFNDHLTSLFFNRYSAFTRGVGEEYAVAGEGGDQPAKSMLRRPVT